MTKTTYNPSILNYKHFLSFFLSLYKLLIAFFLNILLTNTTNFSLNVKVKFNTRTNKWRFNNIHVWNRHIIILTTFLKKCGRKKKEPMYIETKRVREVSSVDWNITYYMQGSWFEPEHNISSHLVVWVLTVTTRFFIILFSIILCVFIYACMWLVIFKW